MEDWDDVWRRNQFVCGELARRHPEMKILFVGLPLDVSNRLRRGRLGGLLGRASRLADGFENITLSHPVKLLPNTLRAGRWFNEALFRRHVRREAARLGMQRPVLWLNPHYAVHMAGRMGESAVIYDITDDWTTLTQTPRLRRLVVHQDDALCRRADATIVCSQRLFEMKRPLCEKLFLIPNGVDAEHYRTVLDGTGPLPETTCGWERPVLGYTGTIHPDRVDVELVEAVARCMTAGTVAMIGPNHLSGEDRGRLEATNRVVFVGPVPYRDVPQYMRAFDVCITPHRVTAFTESLNPIKLWEYLAAGKPIVSTDVAGFRDYPNLVAIARSADEFVRAAGAAMQEGQDRPRARREEARRHSWASRVDQIEAVLDSCIAAKQAGVQAAVAGERVVRA